MQPDLIKITAVLLMPESFGLRTHSIAASSGIDLISTTLDSLDMLEKVMLRPHELLLSFGTGVIVPKSILVKPNLSALNIHAASPDFPGRDPHHFAVYAGAKRYGATLHYMTDIVDNGPIVDLELFDVTRDCRPWDLLSRANEAGFELLRRYFLNLWNRGQPVSPCDVSWGKNKTTRSDFLDLCQVDCEMPKSELVRRTKATSMPGYKNLFIDIHGYRFKLTGKAD